MILTIRCPALALILLVFSGFVAADGPSEMQHDAALNDIRFIDHDLGWAVGERGVVWHTVDGGRNWQRQAAPTQASLYAVSFLDSQRGWIAGGDFEPYVHRSRGVILNTIDGGKTWNLIKQESLPRIRSLRMFDQRTGICVGDSVPMFPSGVLTTDDGGRSWSSLPQAHTAGWVAADFTAGPSGLAVDSSGRMGEIAGTELKIGAEAIDHRTVRSAAIASTKSGWIAGDAGLLAQRKPRDLWERAKLPEFAHDLDFRTVAAIGTNVWAAGTPGSVVLHSADSGATWHVQKTEEPVPLRKLFFLDASRGWAVGELGMILATKDGGATWRKQRSGGSRLALFGTFSNFNAVPLETLVQLAGNEGYLSAIEFAGRDEKADDFSHVDRIRAAITHAGAAAVGEVSSLALPPSEALVTRESLLAGWRERHGPAAAADWERRFTLRLRMWRPDVVLLDDAGTSALETFVNQAALAAVEHAADPKRYPEQIERLGLAPWTIKKAYTVCPPKKKGTVNVVSAQLAPRWGASLDTIATQARSLVFDTATIGPDSQGCLLVIDRLPQGQGKRDFFSGIPLTSGGEARRAAAAPPSVDFNLLARRLQQRRLTMNLFARSDFEAARGAAWLAQVRDITRGLPEEAVAEAYLILAERYVAGGDIASACEAWRAVIEQSPSLPAAETAQRKWLFTAGAAEYAHVEAREKRYFEGTIAAPTPSSGSLAPAMGVMRASANSTLANREQATASAKNRLVRTSQAISAIEKKRPLLHAESDVRFLAARTTREQGTANAENMLRSVRATNDPNWSDRAGAELQIAERRTPTALPHARATRAAKKPKLDGLLSEECWTETLELSDRACRFAFAYDDEHVYIGVMCDAADSSDKIEEAAVRKHDDDLSREDRVEIALDWDRDYRTAYRFAIDRRGRTWEAAAENIAWNPQWFVAHAENGDSWCIEAAVPLAELTAEENSLAGTFRAVSVNRTTPGKWYPEAAPALKERPKFSAGSFGLLEFARE